MATARILLALLSVWASAPASASVVVYNNLGPGDSYIDFRVTPGPVGWNVGNNSDPVTPYVHAMRFRAQQSGYVDQIVLPVLVAYSNYYNTFAIEVTLHADLLVEESFPQPGAALESIGYSTFLYQGAPAPDPLITLSASQTTYLEAGSFYWLSVGPLGDDPGNTLDNIAANWLINDQGLKGLTSRLGYPSFPDSWYTLPNTNLSAYRITALAPVPLPGGALLFFSGAIALAGVRRRR